MSDDKKRLPVSAFVKCFSTPSKASPQRPPVRLSESFNRATSTPSSAGKRASSVRDETPAAAPRRLTTPRLSSVPPIDPKLLFKPTESPIANPAKRFKPNAAALANALATSSTHSILSNVPKPVPSAGSSVHRNDSAVDLTDLSPRKKRRNRDPNGLYAKAKTAIKAAESDHAIFVSSLSQAGPKKAAMKLHISQVHELPQVNYSGHGSNEPKLQLTTARLLDVPAGQPPPPDPGEAAEDAQGPTTTASQHIAEQRALEGHVLFSSHLAGKNARLEPLRAGQKVAVWEPLHAVELPCHSAEGGEGEGQLVEQRNALIVSKWLVL